MRAGMPLGGSGEERCPRQAGACQAASQDLPAWERLVNQGAQLRAPSGGVGECVCEKGMRGWAVVWKGAGFGPRQAAFSSE